MTLADREKLENALALATVAHRGQIDKAGAPYILHPLRVMLALQPHGASAMAVGVLHDVVEDTNVNLIDLYEFGSDVVDAIDLVTKRPDEEEGDYEAFIQRIAASRNRLAILAKLADLRDNADLTRIAAPTDKDRMRSAKYGRAIITLEAILCP